MRDRLLSVSGDSQTNNWNRENYRYFDFDVLLTNPPFAGNIEESRIIQQYDVAKKPSGKWPSKVGRDLLFIQRNLDFLKPGGRMAIVLPEGRLNNTSDAELRKFIANEARILAVVSLHMNTFKPHTNTKTSVLFLQKWNSDPAKGPVNSRVEHYPVFMAISRNGGKTSNGTYLFEREQDGSYKLDSHKHPIAQHDLDSIADQFIAFAKKERLSFYG